MSERFGEFLDIEGALVDVGVVVETLYRLGVCATSAF